MNKAIEKRPIRHILCPRYLITNPTNLTAFKLVSPLLNNMIAGRFGNKTPVLDSANDSVKTLSLSNQYLSLFFIYPGSINESK